MEQKLRQFWGAPVETKTKSQHNETKLRTFWGVPVKKQSPIIMRKKT